MTKLKSFYLSTVPLWTKLMEEKIKNKNEHLKLKDLPIRTIYTETNTNAQVEECFKIKKHSSNINQNINLTEFLESFIQQVLQLNSKDKKKVHKIKSTCENPLPNNMNKVQYKENTATKEEQTPQSDDENINDSDIEDKRNQCSQPSKEHWTDRNESRRKRKIFVYLNEMNDPIVLEPELKSSNKFKISKVKYSKILKKEYWKDEIKSNKIYKDVEKTGSRKAKEHLQQEKVNYNTYKENDSPNSSYMCEKCKSSSSRQGMVHCSNCKFWYHDCCFPTSFDLSLKQPYLVCSNCITELLHEFCCLFYLSQPMNIKFCDI